jgi:hypothetical protein
MNIAYHITFLILLFNNNEKEGLNARGGDRTLDLRDHDSKIMIYTV